MSGKARQQGALKVVFTGPTSTLALPASGYPPANPQVRLILTEEAQWSCKTSSVSHVMQLLCFKLFNDFSFSGSSITSLYNEMCRPTPWASPAASPVPSPHCPLSHTRPLAVQNMPCDLTFPSTQSPSYAHCSLPLLFQLFAQKSSERPFVTSDLILTFLFLSLFFSKALTTI